MRYRTDRIETTEQGQQIGYVDWLGGPWEFRAHTSQQPITWRPTRRKP